MSPLATDCNRWKHPCPRIPSKLNQWRQVRSEICEPDRFSPALGLAGFPCDAETGQTKRSVRTYAVEHSTRVPEPRSIAPSFIRVTPDWLHFTPVSATLAQ